MNLKEAVKLFESAFQEITPPVNSDGDKAQLVWWSGGPTEFDSVAPALYTPESKAVQAWLTTVLSQLPSKCYKLEWILRPEIHKYQITMADQRQRQRLVSDRYTVKSQFVVKAK